MGLGRRGGTKPAGPVAAPLASGTSVTAVALFEPLVAAVVVAQRFPEAGHVAVDQADAADPFRALPEVTSGNDEPGRPAVLRRQRFPVVLPGDECLAVQDVAQRQVRR